MTISPHEPTFIPTSRKELDRLGWATLEVILVTGDAYVDAPHIGVAVIARVLTARGYRAGVIAQPDVRDGSDITRLGEPDLFWGVTGGSVDSMVANFTASGRRRRSDDMTPGGGNTRRPDRAVLSYSNLIRRYFKKTRPIVLGGIEASLRRISHYDAWDDAVRRSILFDAKADFLLYGMADETVISLAEKLKTGQPAQALRGLCYISPEMPAAEDHRFGGPDIVLPAHDAVAADKDAFVRMFNIFYVNNNPVAGRRLIQRQDTRYLVHNPPAPPPAPESLDAVYELPFTRKTHPYYTDAGTVRALETIRYSITTHRGCFGECRFCSITVHQGRAVISRSPESILREAAAMTRDPDFKGVISDVGGPTANMYGMDCASSSAGRICPDKGCLSPRPCRNLVVDHGPQIRLLRALRRIPGIRKVFVASGLRHDLVLSDRRHGRLYMEELLRHHVSVQLKIAPEHVDDEILRLMNKPGRADLENFLQLFDDVNRAMPRRRYLTYYLLAAYPGCTEEQMRRMKTYARQTLRMIPEQVQIFTPTPSTWAAAAYFTGIDPFSGKRLFVEKNIRGKVKQKKCVI